MANYNVHTDIEKLADAYGYDMMLHGKSMYWSSPRECPDTTDDLRACKLYGSLSSEDKSTLLNYGSQMKRYGMGCYQERGACADLYDRYVGRGGVPNPFEGRAKVKKDAETKPNEPEQPGM